MVTATGFDLSVLGDIQFMIDGEPLALHDTITYRGMMFTGIPNMVWVFGYFRASWTLRADLIGDFTCRLLRHMDELGARRVTPQLRPEDADMPILSWIDPDNFNPNYLTRSCTCSPSAADKPEWMHTKDSWTEKDALPAADLDDGCLRYDEQRTAAHGNPGPSRPPDGVTLPKGGHSLSPTPGGWRGDLRPYSVAADDA